MSYARFAPDSDVYVFLSDDGVECCCCGLTGGDFVASNYTGMIAHLRLHREVGDKVPDSAFADLRRRVELAKAHGTLEAAERAALLEDLAAARSAGWVVVPDEIEVIADGDYRRAADEWEKMTADMQRQFIASLALPPAALGLSDDADTPTVVEG